jgi:hypothetical protein
LDQYGIIFANECECLVVSLLELGEWRYLARSRMKLMSDASYEQGVTPRYGSFD